MAFITKYAVTDGRLQLGAEELLWTMPFGTNWQKVRIAFRCVAFDTGIQGNLTDSTLAVGVCQGLVGFQNPATVDWLGVVAGSRVGTLWNRTAGPPIYFTPPDNGAITHTKQGAVTTRVSQTGASTATLMADTRFLPGMHFLDVTKGSPNYAVQYYTSSNASTANRSAFITSMETETSPGGVTALNSTTAVPYAGSGLFSALSIFWSKSVPCLEIADVVLIRFS